MLDTIVLFLIIFIILPAAMIVEGWRKKDMKQIEFIFVCLWMIIAAMAAFQILLAKMSMFESIVWLCMTILPSAVFGTSMLVRGRKKKSLPWIIGSFVCLWATMAIQWFCLM